eukprot:CAMPEP_0118646830 /NCGR_PEP_ID=MMETSP0785-20121206/8276_1 /TAXON_ID=91992 /ORGANISM="Bolidomonas pacifica, Strain CCMP 1866" /LENGTH=145 /DNA_ID=CAMNT_0006538871 /DNA_START=280 /DNA_END=714 /DNA_ORIENTATION=-
MVDDCMVDDCMVDDCTEDDFTVKLFSIPFKAVFKAVLFTPPLFTPPLFTPSALISRLIAPPPRPKKGLLPTVPSLPILPLIGVLIEEESRGDVCTVWVKFVEQLGELRILIGVERRERVGGGGGTEDGAGESIPKIIARARDLIQ